MCYGVLVFSQMLGPAVRLSDCPPTLPEDPLDPLDPLELPELLELAWLAALTAKRDRNMEQIESN